MAERASLNRRKLLLGSAGAALSLGGCDRVTQDETAKQVLAIAETVTSRVQRLISPPQVLARESRKPIYRRISSRTARPIPMMTIIRRRRKGLCRLAARGRRTGRAAGKIVACRAAGPAIAHPNNPA